MKKTVALPGALLIFTGLKAQKAVVKKETEKPVADTTVKANSANNKQSAWLLSTKTISRLTYVISSSASIPVIL